MSTILFQRPDLSSYSYHGIGNRNQSRRTFVSPKMTLNFPSPQGTKDDVAVELQNSPTPHIHNSRPSNIQFDRLQPSDKECDGTHKIQFGQYVARAAVVDEEYWAAAWLRAESHWEGRPPERYMDSYKRKFADQEFNAIKRRCNVQHNLLSTCIVAVKKENKTVKRTVLKSVVGTLDLSFQYLLQAERFPGERVKSPIFCGINRTNPQRYGYVANLCVAKSARRQGIATNMLQCAIESAKAKGVDQVFVHVLRTNEAAREVYRKMGFQIVEMATPHLLAEEKYLLCIKT